MKMTIKQLEEEINKLENGKMTYGTCQALASLYIIKDHMMEKKDWNYNAESQPKNLEAPALEIISDQK